jgi:hypothetical protein
MRATAHHRKAEERPYRKLRVDEYRLCGRGYAAGCLIENIKLGDLTAPAEAKAGRRSKP